MRNGYARCVFPSTAPLIDASAYLASHTDSAFDAVLNRPLWGCLNMDADQLIGTDGEILNGSAFGAVLNAERVARGW